ncbi:MAG: hypothetical protein COC09_05910 [Gammaproteobacteria bacterium]|nr:hypothetical protein [Gammaproteobacteria bacterium]PCH63162.1 MAG: hypothetical protein COC09_06510 [Gammaproteobacteria bacterium]PCH63443.1 MAG: hypothetical protein COC09_05910 [Gammaproteobacteria bacterium]
MEQGTVIVLDEELAVSTVCLGIEFKLPLADSIIYVTAKKHQAVVWIQDADFKDVDSVKFYPKAKAI